MTRDEWNELAATRPATKNQWGAVMRELERLGLADDGDRDERLAVCGRLLELDAAPGSIRELTLGQAGWLLRVLMGCQTRAQLMAAAAEPPRPEPVDQVAMFARILLAGSLAARRP